MFQDHQNSKEHKKLSWATQQGEKIMKKRIRAANKCCDEVILTLSRVAYFLGKETTPFNKYATLCELLVANVLNQCIMMKTLVLNCYFAYLM